MRHWRWYSKLLFAILVAAFAYFVWVGVRVSGSNAANRTPAVPLALRDEGPCIKCGSTDLSLDWGYVSGGEFNRDVLTITCEQCGYWYLRPSLDVRPQFGRRVVLRGGRHDPAAILTGRGRA